MSAFCRFLKTSHSVRHVTMRIPNFMIQAYWLSVRNSISNYLSISLQGNDWCYSVLNSNIFLLFFRGRAGRAGRGGRSYHQAPASFFTGRFFRCAETREFASVVTLWGLAWTIHPYLAIRNFHTVPVKLMGLSVLSCLKRSL